jgi:ATP-dependent DNA helicase PIF1
LIIAPTGSVAALLNGSIYHSALGINDRSDIGSAKKLMQIHSWLEGVDYIFLDEVSMLSCHDFFNISAQLAKGTNDHKKPFGRMNVIFASDFAHYRQVHLFCI